MSGERQSGGCQCGAIRFAFDGPPRRFTACHCRMCQRAVGNAFAPLVELKTEAVRWTGDEPALFASSSIAERGFCGHCGTPLFYRQIGGDSIEIMAGALDEPDAFQLDYHYGAESMRRWLRLDDGLPRRRTREADLTPNGRPVISRQSPTGGEGQ